MTVLLEKSNRWALVIEDLQTEGVSLSEAVSQFGFNVTTARNYKDIGELLVFNIHDVVLWGMADRKGGDNRPFRILLTERISFVPAVAVLNWQKDFDPPLYFGAAADIHKAAQVFDYCSFAESCRTFPAARAPANPRPEEYGAGFPRAGKQAAELLIIEDEASLSSLLKREMEAAGHRVSLATRSEGKKALSEIHKADLVLLNYCCRNGDGWDIFHRLKETDGEKPVILYVLDKGKPANVEWILRAVNEVLKQMNRTGEE